MRISEDVVDGITIIAIAGDEDTKSDEGLTRVFRRSFDHGCYSILLDLEKLKYLGSRMLKVLIANTKEALNAGGKVKLLSPQPHVRTYLRDSRLIDFFEIFNTRQLALESFQADADQNAGSSAPAADGTSAQAQQSTSTDRVDRIENQLIALVNLLRARGILSADDERQLFP